MEGHLATVISNLNVNKNFVWHIFEYNEYL